MNRDQKHAFVESASGLFSGAGIVIVTQYQGLNVSDITELRGKVREAGARFQVMKNRLVKRALKGTIYESLEGLFTGPTAVTTADDPVSAAKVLVSFAKDHEKLILVGGAFGAHVMDQKGIEQLSKMPSLDEIRAKIVGMIQTPATRMATVLQAPGSQLARVCGAYAESGAS
jgi:large subunit ribosomal protein L10